MSLPHEHKLVAPATNKRMLPEYYILTVGYIFGFYMAWNIGANDVANSMASAVGAKAITIRQAIFIAGILNIVGAMIGFGIMAGGFSVINWAKLGAVVLSWVISPVFSMTIGFFMFKIIIKLILSKKDPYTLAIKLSPLFIGVAFFVVILSFLFKTPLGKKLSIDTPLALVIAFFLAIMLGSSVDFAAATTVLIASKRGLPVSTTHASVGGVMGVGIARGIEAVNFRIIFQIIVYWILTVPAAALTSMVIFKIIQLIF